MSTHPHNSNEADGRSQGSAKPKSRQSHRPRPPAPPMETTERPIMHFDDSPAINEAQVVRVFADGILLIYEPAEEDFFLYNDFIGAWEQRTAREIREMFIEELGRYACTLGAPELYVMRTKNRLDNLTELLRGRVSRREFFARSLRPNERLIHIGNGMLSLPPEGGVQILPFSPDYRSRNPIAIPFEPDARCPRFLAELLEPVVEGEDIALLQRYAGAVLLGGNIIQRMLVLVGPGGSGKTTWVEVVAKILGTINCVQIRTKQLETRFELAQMLGKRLLVGTDVSAKFLQVDGAKVIKSLIGGDSMTAECKGITRPFPVRGEFAIIVSANTRLRLSVESPGDGDAWRRRLLFVPFLARRPGSPVVRELAEELVRKEGPGILAWMVEGARRLLDELAGGGDLRLTTRQLDRVEDLLAESDSVTRFVQVDTERRRDQDVTNEELVTAYQRYCHQKGWQALPESDVKAKLRQAVIDCHQLTPSHDIQRGDGRTQRGYRHLAIVEFSGNDAAPGALAETDGNPGVKSDDGDNPF